MNDASVLIAARNAAATIERAVRSACSQSDEVILVDDWSTDATLARAREAGGRRLRVVRPVTHVGLGDTRQNALDALRTDIGVWLDADDELMPGRIDRVRAAIATGSDLVADDIDVYDGASGAFRCRAEVPAFVRATPVRLFERSYLPAPGLIGFRAAALRRVGYDRALHGCEDVDVILRALRDRARLASIAGVGCRVFAYSDSVSRDRANQRAMYKRVLQKHDYEAVRQAYGAVACDPLIASWALVSIAMFRQDFERADAWLDEIAARDLVSSRVLEPEGPCPRPEAWRMLFHRGTIRLLLGDHSTAIRLLQAAEHVCPTPEAANNLGVALAVDGRLARAHTQFELALERHPGFVDARTNCANPTGRCITTHPLRHHAVRADYRAA